MYSVALFFKNLTLEDLYEKVVWPMMKNEKVHILD